MTGLPLENLDILVADDHAVVRRGMRHILEQDGARVVEAGSGEECLDLVGSTRFDVLLIDISLPRKSGLEVVSELRESGSKLPILVVSMHPEENFALRALKLGAQGYLPKTADSGEIVKAVKTLHSGKRYLTAISAERLAQSVGSSDLPLHETLSNREFEVFRLLGSGRSLSDTATLMGISPKTVSTLRERILRKTGFTGNMEIVRYSLEHGLI
ncbi:MAG TPA: response regulator transcription factor [Fibrobacteria bacterium]|nr:response regulator transcription factor [Fibrobacteria bacterium]